MILDKTTVFILGVALAIVEAAQQYFHMDGYAHAAISMAIVSLGVMGVQALDPAAIAAKLPAHLAAIAAAVVGGINVFQQAVPTMSTTAHAIIGFVVVLAATLGIHVTGLVPGTASVRAKLAARS